LLETQNLTQQKHTCANHKKCTTTQNKHKKLKSGLVASYGIRPGNGKGLFIFWRFINLSLPYLRRHSPTYLQPRTQTGQTGYEIGDLAHWMVKTVELGAVLLQMDRHCANILLSEATTPVRRYTTESVTWPV